MSKYSFKDLDYYINLISIHDLDPRHLPLVWCGVIVLLIPLTLLGLELPNMILQVQGVLISSLDCQMVTVHQWTMNFSLI